MAGVGMCLGRFIGDFTKERESCVKSDSRGETLLPYFRHHLVSVAIAMGLSCHLASEKHA